MRGAMQQTLLQLKSNRFDVESASGFFTVKGLLRGTWTRYEDGTEELYLHNRLGINAASRLPLWEELTPEVKVTKNEDDKIIGIAVYKGAADA